MAYEESSGSAIVQKEFGPANIRLLTERQLISHFRRIATQFPVPVGVGIGMAGARTAGDRERISKAARVVWPQARCHATNDLETALAAAGRQVGEEGPQTRVLVLSGTGSCCFGRSTDGRSAKIGGWGHILGDKGSGHEIGLRGLKAVVYYFDRDGSWTALGRRILTALQLNEPNDLIGWVQSASKTEVAGLAVEVFAAAKGGDRIARDILHGAADTLASDALACASKLAGRREEVQFVLSGSVLLKQPAFARRIRKAIREGRPPAKVVPLTTPGVLGALYLARQLVKIELPIAASKARPSREAVRVGAAPAAHFISPTELRHPKSMNLDRLSVEDSINLMLDEDSLLSEAIRAEKGKIARVVRWITTAFRRGGRLFYVGAGTSGRLGILDASECPPTFRTPPEMVQGIIAGGQSAIWKAVEGAEDDALAGSDAIRFRGITRKDVVVGIAASGRTPFVWGAFEEARRRGARTALVCFNPTLVPAGRARPHVIIAPAIGPEILTGSTRLKSGTATKLILNIFTTLAMVRIGKVVGNLMVDLNPSNSKLRDRAARIVSELTGADYEAARSALEKTGWVVKSAIARLR